ncbi:NUDIX domain-containing protein [Arcanobacterium phocae]|uniref:NUDIX domain-containing protein n=2 Tax=Arcanobacterium phocae TaxID=131112 RepID=UPI001C0ECD3D|nr:NUDIX hydrolase [Arcanobacterium phocae]
MSLYPTVVGDIALKDLQAPEHVATLTSEHKFGDPIFDIYDDQIKFAAGDTANRQYMTHDDAVAIVAVRPSGPSWEVLLINQYRHAPRQLMWEVPAGLCDVPGEEKKRAAQRELAEETGYAANEWLELISFYASAGVSDEKVTVFLASDVSTGSNINFEKIEEEREITVHWVDIRNIVQAIFRGDLTSPALVAGVLAANEYLQSQTFRP